MVELEALAILYGIKQCHCVGGSQPPAKAHLALRLKRTRVIQPRNRTD